ncbi:MAG: ABC transporter substrate-binding protein [Methylocystaceae bacterium]
MARNQKVALLVLLVFLVSIVAGCSSSKTGDKAADQGKEAILGVSAELSGGVASYGTSCKDGIMLAIDEINAAGGVNGQKIAPEVVDTKSDAAEATNVAAKLMDKKVVAVIGPLTSGNVKATAPVVTQNKVPLIAPAATADDVTIANGKVREYIFRTCFSDSFQGILMADFASKNLGKKTAALLVDNSNDYSKGLAKNFKEEFTKLGGTIVTEEACVKGDRDFKATLTKIKSKNPEFLYIPNYYEEAAPAIKQARELGITVPVGGADGWDSPELVSAAGASALNSAFITSHYSTQDTDPKIVKFISSFKAKYNKEPDSFAALGYDAVYLWADAAKRAGKNDAASVTKALAETKDFAGVTGKMTVDENHNVVKAGVIIEYKDGKQTMNTKIQP